MKLQIYLLLIFLLTFTSCAEYIVEEDGVYYKDWNEARGSAQRLLEAADPETFEVLEHDAYAKDKELVFYQGRRIEGAHAPSFESVADFYARDKYRGYYAGDSIEASRGKGFKIINSYYSTDGQDVFYKTKPLKVCSAKNFEFVFDDENENDWERWTTDGCFYYISNFKVPSNDYKSIVLYKDSGGFAKDSRYVYFRSRKINFNDEGQKILDTVDVASFTVTGYFEPKDKFGCINPYHGRKECK